MSNYIASIPPAVRTCIDELLQNAHEPLSAFIYDLDALRSHVSALTSSLPAGVELYYAIKANSEAPVLAALAPFVDGFEISSGGEIARVMDCKQAKPFIFSGPGKLDSDFYAALKSGVELIHIESLAEIARLNRIAAELDKVQPVLLRINPLLPAHLNTKLSMAGVPTPFGIEERQLAAAVAAVEASSHLDLRGFHIHAMSHQLEQERHRQLLGWYLDSWPSWRALASRPERVTCLNVGGGIGVDYQSPTQFDWPALCGWLDKELACRTHAPRLRFELGRFVSAFCGYYVMQVLDIKDNHGESFIIARGGTHQFRLPAAQAHNHPVIHLSPTHSLAQQYSPDQQALKPYTLVGQLCTPKDVLARGALLAAPAVGDLLVMPLAGAYGYNISHLDFLCHPRPTLCFVTAEIQMHSSISHKESRYVPALEL